MNHWVGTKTELIPDFIIGGAMKSGTTTLHNMLNKHPKIHIPQDEVHFFDIDNILQHNDFNFYAKKKWIYQSMNKNPQKMWDWYYDKFREGKNLIKGEDSTTYLASKVAARRISLQKKTIKIIFLLRQPTLRTYSNYWHLLRTGRATYKFENNISYNPYPIINGSLYKQQIEGYHEHIPQSNIKVILFEDFISNTEIILKDICEFLNINYQDFPKDILTTHSNKARVPKNESMQIKRNCLLRRLSNTMYNNTLPYKCSQENKSIPIHLRFFNKIHSKINPHLEIRPPKINPETKLFLDKYFYNELQGIDELLNQDVLSKWFPELHKANDLT